METRVLSTLGRGVQGGIGSCPVSALGTAHFNVPPLLQSPSLRIISPKNRLAGAGKWVVVELGPGGEQSPEDWAGPPPAGHDPLDTKYAFVDLHAIIILGGSSACWPRSTQHKVCVQYNGSRHSCDHQSCAGPPPNGHGPLDT